VVVGGGGSNSSSSSSSSNGRPLVSSMVMVDLASNLLLI